MFAAEIRDRANQILLELKRDARLGQYVDESLAIPQPFRGKESIRLLVLGQDPTIKDTLKRKKIKTVLNLDKNGSARAYMDRVCLDLGICLGENIYATNLYKNFFVRPPTEIKEIDIFHEFAEAWLPLLIDELKEFGDIPLITLGEPILAPLIKDGAKNKIRDYWGYRSDWQTLGVLPFQHISPSENKL